MSDLRARFGRRLRLGMIGGGPDSWIGRMHQGAAQLDGWWDVAAGVFSSDPGRSRAAGTAVGVAAERSYGDVAEMIALERARPDGIDAVAIMTPNDTHYPFAVAALEAGLDVIADKPVSYDAAQARDLAVRARAGGRLFAMTHGYAAYPMTRLASRLVRDGEIGALRLVQVEYIQGGLAAKIEDGPQTTRIRWLFDPSRSGLAQVMSAIGCHAQHLACFVTGRDVARVAADVGTVVPGRRVIDHVSALVEFEGGCKGTFTAFQAAAGAENDIRLRVYGERGMVDWSHRECSYLRLSMHGRAGARHRPRRPGSSARDHQGGPVAARAPGGPAAGVCEHLRRGGAGAHGARSRRRAAGLRVSAHRRRRAHDGVHRGLPGVARSRRLGGRREIGSPYGVV